MLMIAEFSIIFYMEAGECEVVNFAADNFMVFLNYGVERGK
jgi:hypothetical protein